MHGFLHDLRFSARALRQTPGFTLIAALSLALGIGANTTIFSALDAFLFRPLPYPHQERLAALWTARPALGEDELSLSYADFADVRAQRSVVEAAAAYRWHGANLAGGEHAERITGFQVTADFFPLLGVRPLAGRVILPTEDKPGAERVVVLSEGLWERRFGRDRGVLGSAVRLNGEPHTVVGILPERFRFPSDEIQFWTPLAADPAQDRDQRFLGGLVRLRPGVSFERARAELAGLAGRLAQEHPASNAGTGFSVMPLHEELYGKEFKLASAIVGTAVALVLLIACANVANLLLVRAAARERELAVRSAIGAGRGRVVRQLLTESVLLGLLGGGLGAVLAIWGTQGLRAMLPAGVPRVEDVTLSVRALVFTAVLSGFVGVLFGLAPAFQASRTRLTAALREGGRGATTGRGSARIRTTLVVAEIAMALVLLVSTGLLLKGFRVLRAQELGFEPKGVLTMSMAPPETRYPDDAALRSLYPRVVESVASLPGVEETGLTSVLPMLGNTSDDFSIEGAPPPQDGRPSMDYRAVSPDYLKTLRVPLLAGRWLTEGDREDAARVVLVNRAMARRWFPNADPLGRRLLFRASEADSAAVVPWEIVGVVGNVREFGFDAAPPEMVYVPYRQRMWRNMDLIVRTSRDPDALAAAVRARVQELDSDQAIFAVQSLETILARVLQGDAVMAKLLAVLAGVALLLAVVGIYGIVAYSVGQRTHEIGVRMALGARAGDVVRLVLRQGLGIALVGVALGLLGALGVTRFLASFLYGVSTADPATFALTAAALTAVALLACGMPARRAAAVDPLVALREE